MPQTNRWTTDELGDWSGRRVVITGANSGIGLEATRALVEHGATVVMACRDPGRALVAARTLPSGPGSVAVAELDLADFSSIRRCAGELAGAGEPVYALVNNAGIMATPFRTTVDGIEAQMGTNHFGHALLTALLLGSIAPGGRVVVISSIAARGGRLTAAMTAEDLTAPVPYSSQGVYSNTKQANLLFAEELHRRVRARGLDVTVVAAHPGVSATELFARQLRDNGKGMLVPIVRPVMRLVLQSAAAGAAPTLRALSDPSLRGGELIGPVHLGQSRGSPRILELFPQGADATAAARLFELTEEIIGTPIVSST